ncbi:hypothetical protein C7M84_019610 [Penaeus vannamei]|uniref:Uncharacterized protein n=1 Tax=Penaeus vannamei TaxID=6689 RepID=A0A423SED8_PENVA|nr:hypothetical protein C7M84_019610 [Penaeus vannamei]
MEWNSRQQILQKWQPFGLQQQMQQIQQQQIQQHQLQTQHQQHHPQQPQQQQQPHQQPPPPPHVQPAQVQQQQQQPQPMPQQLQQPQLQQPQQSHKIPRTGGSATPHCLVTTSFGKMQIHNVLGSIVNQELNAASIHSSIVCKKCFKLLDDIDALEGQLVNMKQVVSSKYTMTLALVKKGLVGKAVLEEPSRQPPPPPKEKKIVKTTSPAKGPKPKGTGRRGRPPKVGRPRKSGNLSVKAGKLVVKGVDESLAPEVELKEEHGDFDDEEKTDQDHEEAEETDDENTPLSSTAGEGSSGANNLRSPMPGIVRKRKFNREPTHTTTMHLPQGPPQPAHNGMEETIPHFVIPTNDNREQPGAGETMGYMFSTFQSQGTVGHYAPLNLGQW